MPETRTFLTDLALVFCVATAATLIFQRLRQPPVLGYLLAGVIVGPGVPIPLFAEFERVEQLAELGVILVMFSIGLELRLSRLARMVPTAGLTVVGQITAMVWLGYVVGRIAGWDARGALFVGGIVCISSTMVASRALATERADRELKESVLGILVMQDLAVVVLLTVFTAIAEGSGLPPLSVLSIVGELALFLVAVVIGGMFVVPRLVRESYSRRSSETILIGSVGVCFGLALLAHQLGYSVALGALLGGVLVGESGRRHEVERQIAPLRDIFAAVFFVSVGMLVEPRGLLEEAPLIVALALLLLIVAPSVIALGAFLTGTNVNRSIRTGMSLAQTGEFSFIIVGIGVAGDVVPQRLYTVAVGVAVLSAFWTPFLVRRSEALARMVEHRLPQRVQTFAPLYGSWIASLGQLGRGSPLRRIALVYLADAALLVAALIAVGASEPWLSQQLEGFLGIAPERATFVVTVAAVLLAAPFAVGVVRLSRSLGVELARHALPLREEGVDFAYAPRRAFLVTLQLGLLLIVAFPVLAVSQPFFPPYLGVTVLLATLTVLALRFWHTATDLQDHVRAGAELVLEALQRQRRHGAPRAVRNFRDLVPGLGPLETVLLEPTSPAIGRTLAELELRSRTGAYVIVIQRTSGSVVTPTGSEALEAGDRLSLSGSEDAIEAARRLLRLGP